MNNDDPPPPLGRVRLISAGLAALGTLFLLYNSWTFASDGRIWPAGLVIGPVTATFGLAGAVEPRIVLGVSKWKSSIEKRFVIIGYAVGALTLAITAGVAYLVFVAGPFKS
jgi:hypothetical protein